MKGNIWVLLKYWIERMCYLPFGYIDFLSVYRIPWCRKLRDSRVSKNIMVSCNFNMFFFLVSTNPASHYLLSTTFCFTSHWEVKQKFALIPFLYEAFIEGLLDINKIQDKNKGYRPFSFSVCSEYVTTWPFARSYCLSDTLIRVTMLCWTKVVAFCFN